MSRNWRRNTPSFPISKVKYRELWGSKSFLHIFDRIWGAGSANFLTSNEAMTSKLFLVRSTMKWRANLLNLKDPMIFSQKAPCYWLWKVEQYPSLYPRELKWENWKDIQPWPKENKRHLALTDEKKKIFSLNGHKENDIQPWPIERNHFVHFIAATTLYVAVLVHPMVGPSISRFVIFFNVSDFCNTAPTPF